MNRSLSILTASVRLVALAGATCLIYSCDAPQPPSQATTGPAAASTGPFRYDIEHPSMQYATAERTDPITQLEQRITRGEVQLEYRGNRGYLDSLLGALNIDPASQVLVFSKTSQQAKLINSHTPRAIYFNDNTYVAWVPGIAAIEIASMDPHLGPVFYLLDQSSAAADAFEPQTRGRCLGCHDSYSLSGGGVPRFLVGSGYIDARGEIIAHEGWILTSPSTPLESRWGGWYVTGRHGHQVHLGNMTLKLPLTQETIDAQRVGNIDSLEGLVDTSPYLTGTSDIAALMVLEHQINVQNLISRVQYDVSDAIAAGASDADLAKIVTDTAEPLVEAMLFAGEVELTDPISGRADFAQRFEARGPRDGRGCSLHELALDRRTFRYAPSYLVDSPAFDGLPDIARAYVYRRFVEVLSGADTSATFAHLTGADRKAGLQILTDTKPEFAAFAAAHMSSKAP